MRSLLALALLLTPTLAAAQAITGTVRDNSGPVVGAAVTATDVARNRERLALTDDAGRYRVEGVSEGSYRLRATAPGYRAATVTVRATGGTVQADLTLAPER